MPDMAMPTSVAVSTLSRPKAAESMVDEARIYKPVSTLSRPKAADQGAALV